MDLIYLRLVAAFAQIALQSIEQGRQTTALLTEAVHRLELHRRTIRELEGELIRLRGTTSRG